jgi:hypothetical protein
VINTKTTPHVTLVMDFFQLTKEVPHSIEPAIISLFSHKDLYGLYVTTVGWGETNEEMYPENLKTANLKVIPNDLCSDKATKIQGKEVLVHDRLLCTAAIPYASLHYVRMKNCIFNIY